jgi:hypothetical protein
MRRGIGIVAIVVVLLAGVGIGVGAYHAGVDEGIRRTADASQVVEVVGYRGGFFPFGFFLFPVLLFGGLALARAAFAHKGGHDHGGHRGHGPWSGGPPWASQEGRTQFEEKAAEWHRGQHGDASTAAGGTTPAA